MKRRMFTLSSIGVTAWLAGCSVGPDSSPIPDSDTGGTRSAGETPADESEEDTTSSGEGGTSGSGSEESGSVQTLSENRTEDENPTVELEANEPSEVVLTFYRALYAPDVETANSLIHPESSETLYSEEAVARFEGVSHNIEGLEVVEEEGQTAVVEFVLALTDSDGEERRTDMRVELRLDGEEWKIWEAK